jgi:hypothetical protein
MAGFCVLCVLRAFVVQSTVPMRIAIAIVVLAATASAAPKKPHSVVLGKAQTVTWSMGPEEQTAIEMKVRPLIVNGDVKEMTSGEAHDVTDRLFVIRRAFRLNDSLPGETAAHWKWQPGDWILVSRANGHITKLALPEFDSAYSAVAWYRDYAAYCGVSDVGDKVYAIVWQIGRRKPVLKKLLGDARDTRLPDSECATPEWQRAPMRVTFAPAGKEKLTFGVHNRSAELAPQPEPADDAE